MTFDSYCDKIHHRSYNTYTFHHIDEEWDLKSRVLKTSLMELSHTARNICDDFNNVVSEYDLNDKKPVCVTDSAANMIAAVNLIGNRRLPCKSHKVNTLIQKDMLQDPSMGKIRALLAKIRDGQKKLLYRFEDLKSIRAEDNQNKLSLLLNELCELEELCSAECQYVSDELVSDVIQSADTNQSDFNGLKSLSNIRFGCLYKLSKSYDDNKSIIKKGLENLEKYNLIMSPDEQALLSGLVELLEIFEIFSTFSQGNEYPTINTFVLFYTEIDDRLRKIILHDDNEVITKAAKILLANLDKRLPLSEEYIGAALIDPNMQHLPIIEDWLTKEGMYLTFIYSSR